MAAQMHRITSLFDVHSGWKVLKRWQEDWGIVPVAVGVAVFVLVSVAVVVLVSVSVCPRPCLWLVCGSACVQSVSVALRCLRLWPCGCGWLRADVNSKNDSV